MILTFDFIPKTQILLYLTGGVAVRKRKKERLFKIINCSVMIGLAFCQSFKKIIIVTNIQRIQHIYRKRSPYYHTTAYGCIVAARSPPTTVDPGMYVV